jgi:hypothetical protein
MAKRNKSPRHVRVYHYMPDSAAWRTLDVYARAAYVEMAKRYGGPGSNNGRLIFSCRQAAEMLHCSTRRPPPRSYRCRSLVSSS